MLKIYKFARTYTIMIRHLLQDKIEHFKRRKHPTPSIDVDEAWQEFQTYYNTPEGEGRSLYPMGDYDE